MTTQEQIEERLQRLAEEEQRRREWANPVYRAWWWAQQVYHLNRIARWDDVRPEDRPRGY